MPSDRLGLRDLHQRLVSALGDRVLFSSDNAKKPLELDLDAPLPRRGRFYLYNLTSPPGGRTLGEHKIQLIVPGQERGARGNFDYGGGRLVFLCGYDNQHDVFVFWDAGLYVDFAYSMNVQVRAETVYTAYTGTVAEQVRRRHSGSVETVVAAPSRMIVAALQRRTHLSLQQLLGRGEE